jgi:serine/threonine protein phosphatase PrpC
MSFLTATRTDIGTRKKTNEDSVLIIQAQTDRGPAMLVSVCDGMGGLAKGEVASSAMVQALDKWFKTELPRLISEGFSEEKLQQSWTELIVDINGRISDYGAELHVDLGTTVTAALIYDGHYYTLNVGDSRVYLLSDNIYQLTKDQTFVQQEMDAGRMTFEESLTDPRRSVLLQCIGASRSVVPAFESGVVSPGSVFLVCCDGFRHVVAPSEFYEALGPGKLRDRKQAEQVLDELIRRNISRGEDDNISAAVAVV